jgi:hypothetical protein
MSYAMPTVTLSYSRSRDADIIFSGAAFKWKTSTSHTFGLTYGRDKHNFEIRDRQSQSCHRQSPLRLRHSICFIALFAHWMSDVVQRWY